MSWFHARAKQEGAYLITHFQLELDGDGQDDDVVCYSFFKQGEGTTGPVVLVGLASGERFALTGGGMGPGAMDQCPSSSRGGGPEVLTLGRSGLTGWSDTVSVRFDRKGPLLVGTSSSDRYHSASLSLLAQRFSTLSHEDSESGEEEDGSEERRQSEHAVVLAPGTGIPAGHAPVWVSWGRKHWSGKEDADLKVHAFRRGNTVTVVAQFHDDHTVVATDTSPKAILGADHLELWWSERGDVHSRPVQLGVARTQEGIPVSTWFRRPGRRVPPPTARWVTPNHVEVDLPVAWVLPKARSEEEDPGASKGGPFTIVFSDSDGKGQETLVSTSDRTPGPYLYGRLAIAPEGRPFPALWGGDLHWERVGKRTTLRSLVW
ncbi:hypothetical protein [Myxococcus sp. NMCA1]|uniref:hypothetical protein n=1 Tax=Myxococcus sp. NMCA1 TaxID=2996785 RepID=UPI002285F8FD|nr:hypothetical protein [Myxococcus sp. NMCA1]WAM23672.1 hypothetical protein OZ403_24295 [Myxococcus sp. NMCA1]